MGGIGITLGIPASAPAKALRASNLRDETRLAVPNDRFAARAVFDRLGFLANLALVCTHLNVPLQIRIEARNLVEAGPPATRWSRLAIAKVEGVPLVPEEVAQQVRLALDRREVREAQSQFQERLEDAWEDQKR